jgi:hypothetical protein
MHFKYLIKPFFIVVREKPTKSSFKKIICWNCDVEIIQYFDIKYKGERGVCPVCGANFPLE